MIKQFDQVVLTVDYPEWGLKAGDVAVAVDVEREAGYVNLEFMTLLGWTFEVVPIDINHIRALRGNDAMTVRTLEGHDFPDVGPAEYYEEKAKKAEPGD